MYANIIVDISHEKLDKTFQYRVPKHLQGSLKIGSAVEIPFGKGNRLTKGYVLELTEEPEYAVEKIKDIFAVCEGQTEVEGRLIALAAWMREYYGSTMIQALKAVLPVKQKIKEKKKVQIRLLLSKEEAEEKLAFFRKKNQKARARLLEALVGLQNAGQEAVLEKEIVTGKLNISAAVISTLEEQGVISCESSRIYRNPVSDAGGFQGKICLNDRQREIVETIDREWEQKENRPYLIHGVTGSGKTEVYMELIACALKRGKQAIVLIPEIALTYQTMMRFYQRFGERISVLHSRLSMGERYDQYERAKKGLIDIMIGPRSALFTPFSNLGIIIIDEEHEDSYKSESVPRYHAREAAMQRASMEGAKLVMGSATPSVESYFRAKQGIYRLFTLEERVEHRPLPKVEILDMCGELRTGNRGILSGRLCEEMEKSLSAGQQVMLFLNRRGYAGFLSCRSCGYVPGCPHCNVSLSLHGKGTTRERLVCHYCGYEEKSPSVCPSCGSHYIGNFKAGTQQVVQQVQQCFPQARVLRMDMDTTKEKDGHAKILTAFARQEADILVGTQMIVKGHDFPNVTLVGVLAADMSLHASDYRAAERTFQLLTQAAGRAGRGSLEGRVLIQTYTPEHYSIQTAAGQDYPAFYEQEILYRKLMGYPPAAEMLVVHGMGEDEAYLQMAMEYLGKYLALLQEKCGIKIIGPADEAVSKVNDIYRKVIYIRHENADVLFKIKQKLEQYIGMNRGFERIAVQFDRF